MRQYPDVSVKVNRLFAYWHNRSEPELTSQAMATVLGQRYFNGKLIPAAQIERLRTPGAALNTELDPPLLEALCRFCGVDIEYLEDTLAASRIDRQLRLWIAVRDRGLDHLAVRAGKEHLALSELDDLVALAESLPATPSPVAVGSFPLHPQKARKWKLARR